MTDKRDLIERTEGLPLWAFWKGEFTTHLFAIDRARAELEVCTGANGGREVDPDVDRFLAWFADEKRRQGLADTHVSKRTPEVTAAKWLLGVAPKARIASVVQWALTDERRPFGWRGNVRTVASLREHWDQLVADWQRNDAPAYDPDRIYEEEAG